MKRLHRFSVLFLLLLLATAGHGQSCDWLQIPGVKGHPSILEIIRGDYSLISSGQMVAVGKPAEVLAILADSSVTDSEMVAQRSSFFTAGLMSLSGKSYGDAALLFQAAGQGLTEDNDCGAQFYRITARYLEAYAQHGDQPLFAHFNGGYYNYLHDSLYWGNKQDSVAYDQALGNMLNLVQWSESNDPIYLELLGDLLTRYRDRFKGNYFGSLVYMRAALLKEGKAQAAYLRKSLFALESPSTFEDRFNQYRFTQLRKALEEEKVNPSRGGKPQPKGPIAFFPATDNGRLSPMLRKAHKQLLNRQARATKYKEEIEIGTVKRDTTFNLYALFVIGSLLAAVFFIGFQMRRHRRQI